MSKIAVNAKRRMKVGRAIRALEKNEIDNMGNLFQKMGESASIASKIKMLDYAIRITMGEQFNDQALKKDGMDGLKFLVNMGVLEGDEKRVNECCEAIISGIKVSLGRALPKEKEECKSWVKSFLSDGKWQSKKTEYAEWVGNIYSAYVEQAKQDDSSIKKNVFSIHSSGDSIEVDVWTKEKAAEVRKFFKLFGEEKVDERMLRGGTYLFKLTLKDEDKSKVQEIEEKMKSFGLAKGEA